MCVVTTCVQQNVCTRSFTPERHVMTRGVCERDDPEDYVCCCVKRVVEFTNKIRYTVVQLTGKKEPTIVEESDESDVRLANWDDRR